MERNYNIYRKSLQLPEYGRHIHQMVDNLMAIENREERNRKARVVINVMGNLNPLLRDTPEFTHKLWDHLFIMSDFKLDVDSPYPIPTSQTLTPMPYRMEYPDKRVGLKHYGKYVKKIIRSLEGADDQETVQEVLGDIARYMRTKSYEYNQEQRGHHQRDQANGGLPHPCGRGCPEPHQKRIQTGPRPPQETALRQQQEERQEQRQRSPAPQLLQITVPHPIRYRNVFRVLLPIGHLYTPNRFA